MRNTVSGTILWRRATSARRASTMRPSTVPELVCNADKPLLPGQFAQQSETNHAKRHIRRSPFLAALEPVLSFPLFGRGYPVVGFERGEFLPTRRKLFFASGNTLWACSSDG